MHDCKMVHLYVGAQCGIGSTFLDRNLRLFLGGAAARDGRSRGRRVARSSITTGVLEAVVVAWFATEWSVGESTRCKDLLCVIFGPALAQALVSLPGASCDCQSQEFLAR